MRLRDQQARAGPKKEGRPQPETAPLLNGNEYNRADTNDNVEGYVDHREAARALILSGRLRTTKAAQFAGGLTVQSMPLSPKQLEWLALLLSRAGLPPIAEGGHA